MIDFKQLFRLITTDIDRYIDDSPYIDRSTMSRKVKISVIIRPEIICIFLYRLSHQLHLRRHFLLARLVAGFNCVLHKANIHPASRIGSRLRLPHPAGVTFEGDAGDNLTVFSLALCLRDDCSVKANYPDGSGKSPEFGFPTLGDNVVLGGQSAVIGKVNIGDNVTVAYHAIVTDSIPSDSVVFARGQKVSIQNRDEMGL